MEFDRYEDAAWREIAWYVDRLRAEGADALWRSGVVLGAAGIHAILDDQRAALRDFIGAPPAKRARALARHKDPIDRHGFLIAATYLARCAAAWLDVACRYGASAGYGPGPRFLLGQAAAAAIELREAFPTLWPFEDHPDPFGPGEP
jgi:hypothetical protein